MTVLEIYDGSDGDATKGLYRELCELGAAGELAMNLFRAREGLPRRHPRGRLVPPDGVRPEAMGHE